ncbi:unnamed protein product [Periconia digitata]|uniref:Uncharacterized protein n=1 Tax=Periconia digitata TaxID=1303443 RepID=A0A9W4XTR8_9PLEO|nr:unnamed protein product [Periconia digitata]
MDMNNRARCRVCIDRAQIACEHEGVPDEQEVHRHVSHPLQASLRSTPTLTIAAPPIQCDPKDPARQPLWHLTLLPNLMA